MKEVYVGIDTHKDENVLGSAFDGRCKGELIGKCSAVLNRTLTFIIIDPLYKLVDGDENSAQDMKPILAVFDRVMRETGAALLYVHHDTKEKAGDKNIRDRGAGSGVIARDYDACITLWDGGQPNDLNGTLRCGHLIYSFEQ